MVADVKSDPVPVDMAGDGTQEAESAQAATCVHSPSASRFGASSIPDAIDRVSLANPRSMGGEIGAALIAAATRHLSVELDNSNNELRASRGQVETLRAQLANKETLLAVQRERVENLSRGRHVRNLFMILGTSLIGFSIEFFRNNLVPYGYSCLVIGGAIILGTWLSAPRATTEERQ